MKKIILIILATSSILTQTHAKNNVYAPRKKVSPHTEIIHAAARNDLMTVRNLIMEHGADVNVQDAQGQTALHVTSDPEIVFELIISGAQPNLKTKKEQITPLLSALLHGHLKKAMVLVLAGADPNVMYHKKTPIMLASEQHDYALIKELVKAGAKISPSCIDYVTQHDTTSAHFLKQYCIAKNLRGTINTLDGDGLSAMHYAIMHNDPLEFDALLCAGGQLNIQNTAGKTPLHLAVEHNLPTMTQKLLTLQAKIDMHDHNNQTPLQLALQKKNTKIITLLKNHTISPPATQQKTALT